MTRFQFPGLLPTILWFLFVSAGVARADDPAATRLLEQAERNTLGKTFQGLIQMTVRKGASTRRIRMRIQTVGREKALVKIIEPAKDKGTGNLRLQLNLWQYLPNIERIVKIPTSLMLQSWMGSDFTNDDLVRTSSLVRDYTHQTLSKEKRGGFDTVKIECLPKPEAPVVWGKVIIWVRAKDGVPLQHEYYSEKGDLLKRLVGSEIKSAGSHTVPTRLLMTNAKKEDSDTTLEYLEMKFDESIPESLFTQESLRKPL